MKIRLWKKLFLMTLVLLFLLPGCGQKREDTVTVYCLKEIDNGVSKQEYMYDEAGNVLEYYHSGTGRTVCTYDDQNNTLTSDYYLDSLIESTVYTYDESGRMLTKTVTDQSGVHEYTYAYDEMGNLCSETSATPYQPYKKTVYSNIYSEDGALVQSVATSYDRLDAKTGKQVETFDLEGRLITKEHYSGNDSIPIETFQRVYDSNGRCLSESNYRDGELLTRKLYTYSSRGNLLEVRDDPEIEKEFIYRTEYTYNEKGNTISEKEYFSYKGNREKFNKHFTYSYDKEGNLLEKSQLSPNDGIVLNSTTWTYDKAGNVRSETHKPSKDHTQVSTYDEHGNLISYEWSHSNGAAKITYHYVTFQLPWKLAEKVQLQQEAVFEALEYSQIG